MSRIWTDRLCPAKAAVIRISEGPDTPPVPIWKVTLSAPAGTFTVAGGLASTVLLDMATTTPPAGAAPSSVTVAVTGSPPRCVNGRMDSAVKLRTATVGGVGVVGVGSASGVVVTVTAGIADAAVGLLSLSHPIPTPSVMIKRPVRRVLPMFRGIK
jgi:hypothetical protein